jgi:hypothetical protein
MVKSVSWTGGAGHRRGGPARQFRIRDTPENGPDPAREHHTLREGEPSMYLIREVFTAKPGMASKLAKMFQEMARIETRIKFRVMTDAVGPYNTVVMEAETKSLGEFEKLMESSPDMEKMQQAMKGYTDMYLTGCREIYRLL